MKAYGREGVVNLTGGLMLVMEQIDSSIPFSTLKPIQTSTITPFTLLLKMSP